jgi:catalase
VRFSVGGANPKAPDNTKGQRNMALQFNLPGGEVWQMGNISAPVFGAARRPSSSWAVWQSLQPDPATKMPDPAKVKAFADANPEVLLQGRHFASQPVPASFGAVNYWGVHAFGFVNAAGAQTVWQMGIRARGRRAGPDDDEAKAKGPSFPV